MRGDLCDYVCSITVVRVAEFAVPSAANKRQNYHSPSEPLNLYVYRTVCVCVMMCVCISDVCDVCDV